MTLLDIKNIDVSYDDFQVLWNISMNVKQGEMVALLGPNGSGKSTVLNTISNLVAHRKGTISFENKLISNEPTHKRTALGISHVLERRRVFPHLTVYQNLVLGAWHPLAKDELESSLAKVFFLFPRDVDQVSLHFASPPSVQQPHLFLQLKCQICHHCCYL